MERTDVVSSNISSIGWEKGILEVEFESGRIYLYENVSEEIYKDLLDSVSVGEEFNQTIKGRYRFERIK